MKFVKRISLFFIYPLTMFSLGFASNMAIMEFFYPGDVGKKAQSEEGFFGSEGKDGPASKEQYPLSTEQYPSDDGYALQDTGSLEGSAIPTKGSGGSVAVSLNDEPILTANTEYIVMEYNTLTGENTRLEEKAPDKFMGLDRDKLADEIEEYNQNPSLTDLEKGFSFMELISFSPAKVVVRKSYTPIKEEEGFFLLNEDHHVVVYDSSLSYVYMTTDILVDELPEKLQEEILNMKFVEDEGELYNFLESYSS